MNESVNMFNIYYFYPFNCKHYKVTDVAPYLDLENVAIEPDLSDLISRKVKPHHWKLENGKVVEKTQEEKEFTDAWHKKNSQNNPKVIEHVVEKIIPKEIVLEKEVIIEKKVVEYRTPQWCYYTILILATTCVVLINWGAP